MFQILTSAPTIPVKMVQHAAIKLTTTPVLVQMGILEQTVVQVCCITILFH
jgi:hypothetical protein